MQNSRNDEPGRRSLPHEPPHYIGTSDAVFFLTICCRPKGVNQLCRPEVSKQLFDSVRFYYDNGKWAIPLLLLMPDHLHMLARFSAGAGMTEIVTNWKRYVAKHIGIRWQRDFFDHRLRSNESFDDKAAYILQNPIRSGLTDQNEDWPYQLQLD
ncbi:MAG: REP-associated tyrosine transposase [Verrucomicrobiota bacterium]|jgi:putative transposase